MQDSNRMIRIQRSRIHGKGIFARCDIEAGSRVIEYVGRRISKTESVQLCRSQNSYIFDLNEQVDLDGNVSWNPARLINHSCDPNCAAEMDDRDRIWIMSTRAIARGEEVTFNYGYDIENFMNYPCRCGTAICVGYMVAEEWIPEIRCLLSEKEKDV